MPAKQKRLVLFIIAVIGMLCSSSRIMIGNEVASETMFANNKATVAVYTWQQNATADWQSPSSWTPARTSPASSDILVFNIGSVTIATNIPTQTLGRLIVSGNTTLNLQSSEAIVLTIAGDDGDDLQVEQNSALNFNGANAISATLGSGATAAVNGSITFSSSGTAAHRLTGADIASIMFGTGSIFTAGQGFTGNAFGTTNLNSVIFRSDSTYVCIAGSDPFGAAEPNSVVVFQTGSLFSLRTQISFSQTSFASGRTYANFELNYPGGDPYLRGTSPLVMDDLNIRAGQLHFWVDGSSSHSIRGNVTVFSGASLDCQGSFPGQIINLNGVFPQTLTIFGGVGVNDGNTFAIDNPYGVTITGRFVAWNLRLVNGIITFPNPSDYFLVPGTVTRVNGYIDGTLNRRLGLGTYTFDVGTANGYSPVTVQVTAGHDFPLPVLIRAVQTPQSNVIDPSKALSRYWQVLGSPDITSANLTFNYLDPTDIPATANESDFVIQRYQNGFTQPVGVVDTQANTFRVDGLSDFFSVTDWTLAEPGAVGSTPTATSTPTNTPTNTPTSTPTATATGTPAHSTAFDYDGDHKSDISVFRPTDGAWYLQQSQAGLFGMLFGFGSDKIAPADYDGDRKTDIAVYRPSTGIWYVVNSSNGTVSYHVFGLADDLPTPADYDGDGKADISVYRQSNGTWYRQNSSNGIYVGVQFGASEDKPTIGDFDGDGKSDIGVFRPSTGAWYRINSSDSSIYGELFGFGTDVIAPADYDGDGKTDLAVYRPSTGIWYLHNSADSSYGYNVFGLASDIPAPGDFDGDGKADVCGRLIFCLSIRAEW